MKFYYTNAIAALFLAFALFTEKAGAQAVVTSNSGKSITFNVTANSIVAKNAANWGYNYDYNVTYSANSTGNPTINWVTITFESGNEGEKFQLDLSPSQLTSTTTTITTGNNQGRHIADYATATPYSLNARNMTIKVQFSDGDVVKTFPMSRVSSTSGAMQVTSTITPLPVKLTSFNAALTSGNQVALTWATAQENNNAYFIIERSADGKGWSELAKITGAGTTSYRTDYNYTDEQPASSTNYYRLKQVDADGAATYTQTVSVKATDRLAENATIYPNPNNGENIRFAGLQNSADWSIRIINSSSATVYSAASVSSEIALSSLPSGLYFVQLHNGKTGEAQLLKLMRK